MPLFKTSQTVSTSSKIPDALHPHTVRPSRSDSSCVLTAPRLSHARILTSLLLAVISFSPSFAHADTLLEDTFTGSTIDTTKWLEIDTAGSGGTTGNIQQNGSLTTANGYISNNWGINALTSVDTFASTSLEISANLTRSSDQLIGYGDYDFDAPGTAAYIIDAASGGVYGLSWNNGTMEGSSNLSCGTYTAGAVFKMKIISTGFEVYKNGTLSCTVTSSSHLDNKKVFLAASDSASAFDNLLVTGSALQATVPDAPTIGTATAGNAAATVTFTAPASNGGASITSYVITSSPGNIATTTSGNATSGVVTGLTNGTPYTFTVRAVNATGTSTASAASNSVTPTDVLTVPGAPTIGTATAEDTAATVTFTAPASNGGASITGYTVTSSPGGITATGTSSPITITGLTSGVAYTFTVTATNSEGQSASSAASNSVITLSTLLTDNFTGTTIDTDKWLEVDPGGLGGTTGSVQQNGALTIVNSYVNTVWGATALRSQSTFASTSLELSAKMSTQSSSLMGYGDYIFGDATSKAYLAYITSPGSTVLSLEWKDGNYTSVSCGTDIPGATYQLKVVPTGFDIYRNGALLCTHTTDNRIYDKPVFFQSATSVSTFDDVIVRGTATVVGVPDAPTIDSAITGNGRATVNFTAPASNGGASITGYTVTSSPGGITATGTSSPIIVNGLTNDVAYTFTVTATNSVGTSAASASSDPVTPGLPSPAGQVTSLSASGMNQQALLSWDAPTPNANPVTDYLVEYKPSAGSSWSTFADSVSAATKATVTGLTNGTAYDFRVSAINEAGTGVPSATGTAMPRYLDSLAFVMTGESNSGGIGQNSLATAEELAPRPAVQIMNLTSGTFLFEDLDIGTNNLRDHSGLESYYDTSHGLELGLANYVEAHAFADNDVVHLVKTGQGGSKISEWDVGGAFWNKFLQRTAAAKTQLPEDRQWIVWLSLGINDSIAGTPVSTWKTATVAHIDKIKADLPGVIIVMTEFQSMPAGSGYPVYSAAIREIAAEEPNVYSVSSTGAGTDGANHWFYEGLKVMAGRMADTTQEALGLIYPGMPADLQAEAGEEQVTLSWTPPTSDGGSSITDYRIEYKQTSAGSYSTFADSVSTGTSTVVSGLTNGESYDFQVSAVNANGTGNPGHVTQVTNPDSDSPVTSSVAATPVSGGAAITWSTNEPSTSQVQYGLTSTYTASTTVADTGALVTSHSVTLSDLAACATYHYRVLSTDSTDNQGFSLDGTFTTSCTGTAAVMDAADATVATNTGGSLSLGNLSLVVPASFTTGTDVLFQAKQLDADSFFGSAGTPSALTLVGALIVNLTALTDIGTTLPTFAQPLSVTFSYSDDDVAGIDESSLAIYRYDGSSWHVLSNCIVDATANTVTCETSSFSDFGLFGIETESPDSGSHGRRNRSGNRVRIPLATSGTPPAVPAASSVSFTQDLTLGSVHEEVRLLQKYLNGNGLAIASGGVGSSGLETTYFGALTKAALMRFQQAKGIMPVSGYFGPLTRAVINGSASVAVPEPASASAAPEAPVAMAFTRDLDVGMTGEDVKALQAYLNAHGHPVAEVGPGSKGNETLMFGYATQAALKRFQKEKGIVPASGYFGPKTRTMLGT